MVLTLTSGAWGLDLGGQLFGAAVMTVPEQGVQQEPARRRHPATALAHAEEHVLDGAEVSQRQGAGPGVLHHTPQGSRGTASGNGRSRRVIGMYGSILLLHAIGFFVFIVFVVPAHYKGLGIGVSVLAYTLGLRHAFDADHISAIDNTTRKAMNQRNEFVNRGSVNQAQADQPPRPFAYGYFFSLGHSTIVVAIGVGIIIAERTVFNAVSHNGSGLEQFGGLFGTIVSASFLFLIGALNVVILGGIELLSLLPQEIHSLSQTSGFWGFMYNFDINKAGFVIVGMFIATWAAAMLIWRYGHIEEKWSARLQDGQTATTPLPPPA